MDLCSSNRTVKFPPFFDEHTNFDDYFLPFDFWDQKICSKIALNLAKSRIKLLKNRKDIQVKQLRRELAQLLESGQDQTARIRVRIILF